MRTTTGIIIDSHKSLGSICAKLQKDYKNLENS